MHGTCTWPSAQIAISYCTNAVGQGAKEEKWANRGKCPEESLHIAEVEYVQARKWAGRQRTGDGKE